MPVPVKCGWRMIGIVLAGAGDPGLLVPGEPLLPRLIEHVERLVAEFCELRAPARAAFHRVIVQDVADDEDFLAGLI